MWWILCRLVCWELFSGLVVVVLSRLGRVGLVVSWCNRLFILVRVRLCVLLFLVGMLVVWFYWVMVCRWLRW